MPACWCEKMQRGTFEGEKASLTVGFGERITEGFSRFIIFFKSGWLRDPMSYVFWVNNGLWLRGFDYRLGLGGWVYCFGLGFRVLG